MPLEACHATEILAGMASAGKAGSSSSTGTTTCSAHAHAKVKEDSQSRACGDAEVKPFPPSRAAGETSCADHEPAAVASNLTPQTKLSSERVGQEEEGPADLEEGEKGRGGAREGYWWHVNKGGFPIPEHTWEKMWSRVVAVHPDGVAVAEAIRGKPCQKVHAVFISITKLYYFQCPYIHCSVHNIPVSAGP